MSKIRLNQVKLPIFYLFLTYKRQYHMVQPFRFFSTNFLSLKKCNLCSTLCLKMQWLFGPLLQCLTIDKIAFHKIFKKLLQTVKQWYFSIRHFNFKRLKKKKSYSNLDKSYNSKSHFPLNPGHSNTTHFINE